MLILQIQELKKFCSYCKVEFDIEFPSSQARKFCSYDCFKESKKYVCMGCGIKFNCGNRYRPKFCNKQCYLKNQINHIAHQTRPRVYDKHYYCAMCKWVPKNNAVFKPKGTVLTYNHATRRTTKYTTKQDGYYCPKCNQNLRIKKKS